jgi:hypothetical protein
MEPWNNGGELSINKEMILPIHYEYVRNRKIYAQLVPHRLTEGHKQRTHIMIRMYPGLLRHRSFLHYVFIFSKVKTASKDRNADDIKENVLVN